MNHLPIDESLLNDYECIDDCLNQCLNAISVLTKENYAIEKLIHCIMQLTSKKEEILYKMNINDVTATSLILERKN